MEASNESLSVRSTVYFAEERFLSSTYFYSISFKYPAFFSCSTLRSLLTKYLQLLHVLEWSSLYREIFVPVFPPSTANNSAEARNRRKEVAPLSTITKGSFRSLAKIKSAPRRYYSAWRRIRETGCSPKKGECIARFVRAGKISH